MKSTRPLFFAAMIAFAVASTPTFADGVAHVPAVPHLRHQIHQHDRHAAATDVAPPVGSEAIVPAVWIYSSKDKAGRRMPGLI